MQRFGADYSPELASHMKDVMSLFPDKKLRVYLLTRALKIPTKAPDHHATGTPQKTRNDVMGKRVDRSHLYACMIMGKGNDTLGPESKKYIPERVLKCKLPRRVRHEGSHVLTGPGNELGLYQDTHRLRQLCTLHMVLSLRFDILPRRSCRRPSISNGIVENTSRFHDETCLFYTKNNRLRAIEYSPTLSRSLPANVGLEELIKSKLLNPTPGRHPKG
jgi:hypothetical protein